MAWTASNINPTGLLGMIAGIGATGSFYSGTQTFAADTIKVALYSNSVVTATALAETFANFARNAYNGTSGQWVTANELATAGGYTQGGITVTPKTALSQTAGLLTVTSTGTPNWTSASFSTYGCLVYDSTVTGSLALCWNFFGGIQTVTSGTFTINWNASGIFTVQC
jgi:hypothetical protein